MKLLRDLEWLLATEVPLAWIPKADAAFEIANEKVFLEYAQAIAAFVEIDPHDLIFTL